MKQLLQITLAWVQFTVGTGTPYLQDVRTVYPHDESVWFKHLRKALSEASATVRLADSIHYPLLRQADAYLMDLVLDMNFTKKQIQRINYCRMFLNVLTLSDITTKDGLYIEADVWTGDRDKIKLQFFPVNQACPSKRAWKLWRSFLRKILVQRRLNQPLGSWVHGVVHRHNWPFLYNSETHTLLVRQGSHFSMHHRLGQFRWSLQAYDTCCTLPLGTTPVKPIITSLAYILSSPETRLEPSISNSTFRSLIRHQAMWIQELLIQYHFKVPETDFDHRFVTQSFSCATDGSVTNCGATSGWVISSETGQILVECSGPVYGASPTSFRAEGMAIFSLLLFFEQYAKFKGFSRFTNHVHIYTDSMSFITKVRSIKSYDPLYVNQLLIHDIDVILSMVSYKRNIDLTLEWVQGHQDKDLTPAQIQTLPLAARLNILADRIASSGSPRHHKPAILYDMDTATLLIHNSSHHGNYDQVLRHQYTLDSVKRYCETNFQIPPDVLDSIDWKLHRQSLNAFYEHRTWLTKLLFRWLPTNAIQHQNDSMIAASCPSCNHDLETNDHFFWCPHSERQWFPAFRNHVLEISHNLNVPVPLRTLLILGFESVYYERPIDIPSVDPSVRAIYDAQSRIGWNQLLYILRKVKNEYGVFSR